MLCHRFVSLIGAGFIFSILFSHSVAPAAENVLIPRAVVENHGLARGWQAQVAIDGHRSEVRHIKVEAGLLLVVTSDGTLHVFDAETGAAYWTTLVGDPKLLTLGPGANDRFVAAVNGQTVYIYDRASGRLAFRHSTRGTPELGPALTSTRVLVPLVQGPLVSFPLDNKPEVRFLGPQQLPAAGRMLNEPTTFETTVVWGGDRDRLFSHRFGKEARTFDTYVRFGINSGPVAFLPKLYVGTKAGFLVAYDKERGARLWEFPTGSPIFHTPVALADVVYALPQDGGMFAVEPETGLAKWFAEEPVRFAAASPKQVYTIDSRGRMVVLDAATGARVSTLPLPEGLTPVLNRETDRIYLYTKGGFVQCLRERDLVEPHRHLPVATTPEETPEATEGENPFAAPDAPAAEDNPFGEP